MLFNERYTLKEELGKGHSRQFGRTFSGVSKISGEQVLLKFVSAKDHPNGVVRLKNEREFNFSSAGLPNVIDFFESESECILVRNFEEGVTLHEYWKRLASKERIPFLTQFLAKLAPLFDVLNAEGIIHCDIKPSNMIIRSDLSSFEVALIDFGLAIRSSQPENRKVLFPLGFAAPELLLNELDLVNHRTDLFALGITFWNLFTGELPLTHPNPSIFTNLQLTHPLPDHSSIPKGLYPILLKMTNKHVFRTAPNLMTKEDRKKALIQGIAGRYTTITEMLEDLQKIPIKKKWFGF